jgi:glycosyltransferase involved in cell wall biosynthesis
VKIVHVIARLNVGGAALAVLELAAGQQRRGADVLVVAGTIPPGEVSMEHVAAEQGVPYLHLPSLRREISSWTDLRAVRELRGVLRSRRPDVLHTHAAKAGATGRIAALVVGRGKPKAVVHTYHGHVLTGYFDPRREYVYRGIERALAHASAALIAVSSEVRDDLVRLGVAPPEKFTVIPYGFDLDRLVASSPETRAKKRADLGANDDDFVVGWAGRLAPVKRPLDLIRIAAEVEGCVLVLAGDGELRRDAEALARELGVSNRVRFLGYVADMAAWYPALDAFLLVSENEGAPVAAIEALATGVPVVATDAGGTRTVVDDRETGFLRAIGDIAGLAGALTELRDRRDLRSRFSQAGPTRMRERFSVERMVDDVDRLYARFVAG